MVRPRPRPPPRPAAATAAMAVASPDAICLAWSSRSSRRRFLCNTPGKRSPCAKIKLVRLPRVHSLRLPSSCGARAQSASSFAPAPVVPLSEAAHSGQVQLRVVHPVAPRSRSDPGGRTRPKCASRRRRAWTEQWRNAAGVARSSPWQVPASATSQPGVVTQPTAQPRHPRHHTRHGAVHYLLIQGAGPECSYLRFLWRRLAACSTAGGAAARFRWLLLLLLLCPVQRGGLEHGGGSCLGFRPS